jgi:hypothetical protein
MKSTLLIFSIALIVLSCAKEDNFGNESIEINVTTFLVGETSGSITEDVHVYLRKRTADDNSVDDATAEVGYILEAVSDSLGNVNFSILKEGEKYVVYASYKINGVPYYGEYRFIAGKENAKGSLVLSQNGSYNGLSVKCEDDQTAPVPEVDVCFFKSQYLADSAACEASNFSGKTALNGGFTIMNVDPGVYYYAIRDTIGGTPINKQGQVLVPVNGMNDTTLVVLP